MITSVLAIWLLAQPNPPLNPNSVRDNQRFDFFRSVQYQREQGAVIFVGVFGEQIEGTHCPTLKVTPIKALIGPLPNSPVSSRNCVKSREPGMQEVFFGRGDHAVPSSVFFSEEREFPSVDDRRRMVVLAVRAQEALTNEEFLKLARQGLADGFPHVLKGLLHQTRRRLYRAPEKHQDALAVLMLDLFEAKATTDVGCASELSTTFDLTHYFEKPRLPGIRPDTQRLAEEMYAALPEEARNPPPRTKRPFSSKASRERARARARGEKILLGSP